MDLRGRSQEGRREGGWWAHTQRRVMETGEGMRSWGVGGPNKGGGVLIRGQKEGSREANSTKSKQGEAATPTEPLYHL